MASSTSNAAATALHPTSATLPQTQTPIAPTTITLVASSRNNPPATRIPPKINDPPLTAEAVDDLAIKLNAVLSTPSTSPLFSLKQLIDTLVSAPTPVSSYHTGCLLENVSADTNLIPRQPHGRIAASFFTVTFPLNEHRLITCLVLDLAASKQLVAQVHRYFRKDGKHGGTVDLETVHRFQSCDLRAQYVHAVKEAGRGRTTMLGIQLVDVGILEMVELGGKRAVRGKHGFGNSIACVVGPEGVVFWCAGKEEGLGDWVKEGGAEVRTWEDGERWVSDFEKVVASEDGRTKGWNSKRFKRYRRCFGVDLKARAESRGWQLLEEVQPWVRVFRIDSVEVEDVKKWRWETA